MAKKHRKYRFSWIVLNAIFGPISVPKLFFSFSKLFSFALIDINKRTNFCVVIHAQINFAQAKYFIPKAMCLPIGPMMGFPLFPLVWNARSKRVFSSDECFPQKFPNMDHIWGLLGARARLTAPSHLYLVIYTYDIVLEDCQLSQALVVRLSSTRTQQAVFIVFMYFIYEVYVYQIM